MPTTQERKTPHDTAIRTLEFALHPNTSDTEVLAAIRAWRKKNQCHSLEEVCRTKWDARSAEGMTLIEWQVDWKDQVQELDGRIFDLTGNIIKLRQEFGAVNDALAVSQREAKNLRAQLGKREAKGGLPAIRDPEMLVPALPRKTNEKRAPTPKFPVMHTKIVFARFGEHVWDEPNWNPLREQIVTNLLAEGFSFEAINQHIKCIWRGRFKDYPYREALDLTIKTRNPSEICEELHRAAKAFGLKLELHLRYPEKIGRTNGRADGAYATDSAFPNADVIVMFHPDPVDPPPEATTAVEDAALPPDGDPAPEPSPDRAL